MSFFLPALNLRHFIYFLCAPYEHYNTYYQLDLIFDSIYFPILYYPSHNQCTTYEQVTKLKYPAGASCTISPPYHISHASQYNQPIDFGCGFQAQTEQTEVPGLILLTPHLSPLFLLVSYISHILYKRTAHKEHTTTIVINHNQQDQQDLAVIFCSRQTDPHSRT